LLIDERTAEILFQIFFVGVDENKRRPGCPPETISIIGK